MREAGNARPEKGTKGSSGLRANQHPGCVQQSHKAVKRLTNSLPKRAIMPLRQFKFSIIPLFRKDVFYLHVLQLRLFSGGHLIAHELHLHSSVVFDWYLSKLTKTALPHKQELSSL